MVTEKIAKAYIFGRSNSPPPRSHAGFVQFPRFLGQIRQKDRQRIANLFAFKRFAQALAQELPPGMAAIPLNPGIINTEMLQGCFGEGAAAYPTPGRWAETAVPFILNLSPSDNGQPLTIG